MEAYTELVKIFTRLHRLDHLSAICNWDAMANMPSKGSEARGAALAELSVVRHNIITDTRVRELLAQAKESLSALGTTETATLREMDRAVVHATKLPEAMVEKKQLLVNKAEHAWRGMRANNDWNGFLPIFQEVVEHLREEGKLLAAGTDLEPYEALMDTYEPGMRLSTLNKVFADVKSWLPSLLRDVLEKKKSEPAVVAPVGPFSIEKQKALGLICMDAWKFDFDAGRLDISTHPFCGGVAEDVRITTRYSTEEFVSSLLGIVHETGHAKYEQNRPRHVLTTPASAARSMGIHESQSLFAEMQIGRSRSFIKYLVPKAQDTFGAQDALQLDNITRLIREVEPGKIRVDADELCYPLHVLLRYEIEQGLIDGSIAVEDVPNVWDQKMKDYLQVDTVGNFKEGCLQDIHWSMGAFGYFPTYTLGAMYAAQLMAACRRDLGGDDAVDQLIEAGTLEPILNWQKEKIWNHGSLLLTDELVKQATGEPLNVAYYRSHLERRYRDGLL